jgi:hypothetical protein
VSCDLFDIVAGKLEEIAEGALLAYLGTAIASWIPGLYGDSAPGEWSNQASHRKLSVSVLSLASEKGVLERRLELGGW